MKILSILAIVFLIQSVFACPPNVPEETKNSAGMEQSMMNTFGPSSTEIETQANQSIFLQLPSTPGTGYSWNFHTTSSDQSRQAIQSCHFRRLETAASRTPRLGAGGAEIWQFFVDESMIDETTSDMKIALSYNRPWMQQDDKATNTWSVKIRR